MSERDETLVVRIGRPEEREGLEELQRRACLADENDKRRLEADCDAIHLPPAQLANGQVLVAELDGRVAGFAAVVGGELDGLFVEPELWRRGIGATLADAATHVARRKGLALAVIAHPQAIEFFKRCGFSPEGEARTRFGRALRMSR